MRRYKLFPQRKERIINRLLTKLGEMMIERNEELQGYLEVSDLTEEESDRISTNQMNLDNLFNEVEVLREYFNDLCEDKKVSSPSALQAAEDSKQPLRREQSVERILHELPPGIAKSIKNQ